MQEFRNRRNVLFGNLEDNSIVIMGSWPESSMTEDVEYRYRQDPNLYYYTGFTEAHAVIVLEKDGDRQTFSMFVLPKDPAKETWTGIRCGPDNAIVQYGADEAYNNDQLETLINERILNYKNLYYNCPDKHSTEYNLVQSIEENYDLKLIDLKPIVEAQRVIKSPYEIDILRKSCRISAHAHLLAMKSAKVPMWENNLDGLITGYLMWHGCPRLAYPNIVASGNNATTLHYDTNNDQINDNELVLIDAGGEWQYYASDITRTWPINGKFTDEQRRIYDIVLKAQEACIEMVKPGVTIKELQELSVKIITEGLIDIGILQGSVEENIKNESYRKYYMHGVGHWMGIDVHDCHTIDRKTTKLEPGHVFTVEPGIYISNDCELPEGFNAYHGIGVRIEDDVVVTENGCENLTRFVPKEPYIIEQLVGTEQSDTFQTFQN